MHELYSGKDYYFKYPNGDEVDCVIVLYKIKKYSSDLKYPKDDESMSLISSL